MGRRIPIAVVPVVLACFFLGCQHTLPNAPSELAAGMTIYEHANYLGDSALVDKDISNLDDYKGPCVSSTTNPQPGTIGTGETTYSWKNCISSIRIASGWKATIYVDTNYRGRSVDISSDTSNLQLVAGDCDHGGFNDCIESIRIARQ